MKKFLTVLLALSVVFTYTVGSAFAAMPSDPGKYSLTQEEVLKNIDDAYKAALKDAEAEKYDALKAIFGEDAKGNLNDSVVLSANNTDSAILEISLSAVDSVYTEAYETVVKKIDKKYDAVMDEYREAIAAVNENAAKVDVAKEYNGNFHLDASSESTTDDEWEAEGYAKYDGDWAAKSTYVVTENYANLFTKLDRTAGGQTAYYAGGTKANDVVEALFDETKEEALTAVRAIDLSVYSKEYNGELESSYDKAASDVAKAIKALNYISLEMGKADVVADWQAAEAAIAKVNAIYTAPVNNGKPGGFIYTGTKGLSISATETVDLIGLDNITKDADLPSEAAKLEWAQNKVLSTLVNKINANLDSIKVTENDKIIEETLKGDKGNATIIANAKAAIEDAEAYAKSAIEIVTYLVNDCDNYKDLLVVNTAKFTDSSVDTSKWAFAPRTTFLIANGNKYTSEKVGLVVAKVDDLEADAELAKKSIGIDNTTLEDIENALADAVRKAYNGDLTVELGVGDALETLYKYQENLINGYTDIKINDRKYNAVDTWTASLATKYAKEKYADVRKVVADTKDAIRATKTIAEAQAAFVAGYNALEAIPTLADRMTAQSTKEFKDLRDDYAKDITAYADYKADLIKASDYSWNQGTMVGNLIDTLDEAYTVDELKAAYTAAKAEIDALKKADDIETAQKALLKSIKELPTIITVADKATVGALMDAVSDHDDYCTLIGDNKNKVDSVYDTALNTAYNTIKQLETNAIVDMYNTIDKDNKVTSDEADAVKALRAAYDEFVAYYSDPEATNIVEPVGVSGVKVAAFERLLDVALVNDFFAMVAVLPADGSDVAGIKAAREAYEALSRDAKYDVKAYHTKYYSKLVDLEKLIIKNVESLKIKVHTKLYTKSNKIRVNWSVSGNAEGVTGYQVYKSTKAQTGYKYMGKTTKSYMDNKKNLKKGQRYYYKVRAYVDVDGERYYSDWSNKGNRIYK